MRRKESGFTLIEILVVLSLLGVLMGLSIGFVTKLGKGNLLIQTSNVYANLLASARAQSFGNDTAYVSAQVGADGSVTLRSHRNRQVFHWPCEDFERASELGVLEHDGAVGMAEGGVASREGRHVDFTGGRVTIRNLPWLQWVDGFAIQCRIFPREGAGLARLNLFSKGNAIKIALNRSDGGRLDVEASIRLASDEEGEGGGAYVLRTGYRDGGEVPEWSGPIIPGRWYDLRVTYDRHEFAIYVNENLRARSDERHNKMVPETESDFVIGGGYSGGFDSLVISGIFEDDDDLYRVPEQVSWVDKDGNPRTGTQLVHFRNSGLDPRHHSGPVELIFRLEAGDEAGARRIVRVAASGETFVERPGE